MSIAEYYLDDCEKYLYIENQVYNAVENNMYLSEVGADILDIAHDLYITESGKREKLIKLVKKIKKETPDQYDGPESIKSFVDFYYDKIEYLVKFIEKDVKKIRRGDVITALLCIGACFPGVIAISLGASEVAAFVIMMLSFFVAIIYSCINYARAVNDTIIVNELTKIKKKLKKLLQANNSKLDDSVKKKIKLIISSIEDAEITIGANNNDNKDDD